MIGHQIEDCLRHIPGFIGVFSNDNLPYCDKEMKHKRTFALVVNTDSSFQSGTHWQTIIVRRGVCYFFDSLSGPPSVPSIRAFCGGFKKCYYNPYKHQKINEVTCGGFCIMIVNEMMKNGKSFRSLVRFFKQCIRNDDEYIKEYVKRHFHLYPFPKH